MAQLTGYTHKVQNVSVTLNGTSTLKQTVQNAIEIHKKGVSVKTHAVPFGNNVKGETTGLSILLVRCYVQRKIVKLPHAQKNSQILRPASTPCKFPFPTNNVIYTRHN